MLIYSKCVDSLDQEKNMFVFVDAGGEDGRPETYFFAIFKTLVMF